MAKKKVTWYIDEEVVRSVRISAARRGARDSEVVEEALKASTPWGIASEVSKRAGVGDEQALKLAYEQLHAMRAERDGE